MRMGHVIITGPGRAGTSFLMQLLTRMGEETGFEPYQEQFDQNIRAGCEYDFDELDMSWSVEQAKEHMKDVPHIFKAPNWAWMMKGYLMKGFVQIDHIILPFRDFDETARSRLDVGLDWLIDDSITDPNERLFNQAAALAATFGRVMEAAYLFRIPLTIMRYPYFIKSADYCYRRLNRIFDFDYEMFKTKHKELAWT